MSKISFSRDGIIAFIVSLLIIAGAVYWFMNFGPKADTIEQVNEPPRTYATEEDFPSIDSASGDEIERALIDAFNDGRLLEVVSFDIPDTNGDVLVLAVPTHSGNEEQVDCGIRGHRFCALYRKSSNGNQIDSDHVIIGSAWSMMGFTSIERHQLNLENGELLPKLLIELDVGDDFSEMQVSGHEDYISLWLEGYYETGRMIPVSIIVRDADDHDEIYQTLSRDTVYQLAKIALESEEEVKPIFVLPSDEDVESLIIHIELYGEPYVFDLNKKELRAFVSDE
jgi:hypothetical protein